MAIDKSSPRGPALRQHVIDAAEVLLRQGKADFTMRDLAAAAGVSFATPFNQFGSKAAILQALSARRIAAMRHQLAEAPPLADPVARVLRATDIAAAVMLAEPAVNRALMGSIGAPGTPSGAVLADSISLWALALGSDAGAPDGLAAQLAFAFRGVLSFWSAGELADDALAPAARAIAQRLLAGG